MNFHTTDDLVLLLAYANELQVTHNLILGQDDDICGTNAQQNYEALPAHSPGVGRQIQQCNMYIQNAFGRKSELQPTVSEIAKLWDPMLIHRF